MVTFSGPFFTANPVHIVGDHLDQMRLMVADIAETRVRTHLSTHQRIQTGFNVSHVQVRNISSSLTQVQQTNAVYGPWIEGTGSRNKTTRFKGYWSFRTVSSEMNQRVGTIIASNVRAMVAELNG